MAFLRFSPSREPNKFAMMIEPRLLDAKITNVSAELGDEYLEGVDAIAKYLGWNARKVRYARESGALPIRVKSGVGLYAFKSEILAALKTPDTLVAKSPRKAH
jgi:hypothetical protein